MKRMISSMIVILYLATIAVYAVNVNEGWISGGGQQTPDCRVSSITIITDPKMGDAKLMNDKIISGTDGHMIIFNLDGTVYQEYTDIPINWLYTYEPENLVLAANWNNELRMIAFHDDWTVRTNTKIPTDHKTGDLMIDPTLTKVGDTYILTYVEIAGNINNGDQRAENGIYTVKCMKSKNLTEWEVLTDILSYPKNLEDADLLYSDGKLYYFFEKEEYDKGPSSINVIQSEDNGLTWEKETVLIPAQADNEPASVEPVTDGYRLYFSSDRDCAGASYEGAKVYEAVLTKDFQVKETNALDIGEAEGILLYDARQTEKGMCYLYARSYITKNDLVYRIASTFPSSVREAIRHFG